MIGEIPYNTTIKAKSAFWGETYVWNWYYIEYNGVNGWIRDDDGALGQKYNGKIMTTFNGIDIISMGKNEDGSLKKVGHIPPNTILDSYYICNSWTGKLYVTYNEISGYIDNEEVAYQPYNDEKSLCKVDYNGAILAGIDGIIIDIPIGTELTYTYSYSTIGDYCAWVYTEYSNKNGWVYVRLGDNNQQENFDERIVEYMQAVKESVLGNESIELSIYEYEKNKESSNLSNIENKSEQYSEEIKMVNSRDEEIISETNLYLSPMQFTLVCVFTAITILLLAIAVILVVNKSKNK